MADGQPATEPRWLRTVVVSAALAVVSLGGIGLVLADVGFYRWWLVVLLAVPVFFVLLALITPALRVDGEVPDRELTLSERVSARVAVAIAALSVLWNGLNASQHAQINRDGGLYLNAGKWIASHGTLNLKPLVGPFAGNPYVVATSTGMKQRGSHLEFDLSHMLSALLALAQNLGGARLMFLTVPFLSGFALLAFYLLANRLLQHPVWALAATATLALLMPQTSFSRDSTTEIPIQLLLFTAIWLLCDRRTLRSAGTAFTVGLLLGIVQAMHVDGLAFLVGFPAVFALLWLHSRGPARAALKRAMLWSGAGIAVGIAIAAVDLVLWDRYYLSVVDGNVKRLVIVEALAIGAASATVALVHRTNFTTVLDRLRPNGSIVAGILVLLIGFAAWFVRPSLQQVHAGSNEMVGFVQRLNGLKIDPTRRYSELSMRWVSWYVGPITLTIAIVGVAALTVLLVRGQVRLPVQIATVMLAPPALLYLWRPTITPDQIWATRRFLPAVFPAVILLVFAVLYLFARGTGSTFASQRRSVAIVVAAVVVVYPWLTTRNVARMTEQRGLFKAITRTCQTLPDDSAVVMLKELRSVAYLSDPQTLRGFCNVPVAVMLGPTDVDALHQLADKWKAQGKQLYVATEFAYTIRLYFPRARVHSTPRLLNPHLLEPTLTRRPSHYRPESFQLSVAAIPALESSSPPS
jgi:hypothetical protein